MILGRHKLFTVYTTDDYLGIHWNKNGCVIVPFKDEELVLVSVFRKNIGRYSIEFPRGFCDDNESFIQSAKRELQEEAKLTSEKMYDLGELYSDRFDNPIRVILATECEDYLGSECDDDINKIVTVGYPCDQFISELVCPLTISAYHKARTYYESIR